MRLAHAAWTWLVFILLIPNAGATLTVTDCAAPVTGSKAPVSGDCAELAQLSALYGRPARSVLPVPGDLDRILADLGQVPEPKSLWELFTGWAAERFRELREALPDLPNPLRGIELHWPDWLAGALNRIGWALLAVLVVLALVAIGRTLGLRSPAAIRRAIGAFRAGDTGTAARDPLSFADVESAPAGQRPRLLLALVIRALRSAGRLRDDAALSHRQLGPAVREVTAEQRAAIEALAGLAERVTYSRFVPDDGDLTRAVAASHELVAGVAR